MGSEHLSEERVQGSEKTEGKELGLFGAAACGKAKHGGRLEDRGHSVRLVMGLPLTWCWLSLEGASTPWYRRGRSLYNRHLCLVFRHIVGEGREPFLASAVSQLSSSRNNPTSKWCILEWHILLSYTSKLNCLLKIVLGRLQGPGTKGCIWAKAGWCWLALSSGQVQRIWELGLSYNYAEHSATQYSCKESPVL